MAHADYSVTRGKLVYLQKEKPCSWGRKNPMSHLSRMKNPGLPCPSVAAALRAYSYVLSSLDVRTPWEPLLRSLAHPKLGFTTSQLGPAYRLPCLAVVSQVLTIPVCYLL